MFLQILKVLLIVNCVIVTLGSIICLIDVVADKLEEIKGHVLSFLQKINNEIHDNKIRSDMYSRLLNELLKVAHDENTDDKQARWVILNRIVATQNAIYTEVYKW